MVLSTQWMSLDITSTVSMVYRSETIAGRGCGCAYRRTAVAWGHGTFHSPLTSTCSWPAEVDARATSSGARTHAASTHIATHANDLPVRK